MSARQFDLFRAQRRADQLAIVAAVWAVRAYYLTRYRLTDAARTIRKGRA